MLVSYIFPVLMVAMLLDCQSEAATTAAVKLCGRKLSEIMSRVCHVYNSPSWDNPTVVEQPAAVVRKKRQVGIADQCCKHGCTREQLNEYCAVSSNSESSQEDLETHLIADRSAEESASVAPQMAAVSEDVDSNRGTADRKKLVGDRLRGKKRRRGLGRCPCRRRRRSGRRRFSLGNMESIRSAARAAPVVGTVSPLLTWGRTLNTDLPPAEHGRYAYVVYN